MLRFICLCLALLLSACGNSGGGASGGSTVNPATNPDSQSQDLSIAELAPIQVVNGKAQGVSLLVYNNSAAALTLTGLEVSAGGKVMGTAQLGVDSAACSSLPAHSSCVIAVSSQTFNPASAGLYVLTAKFKDQSSNNYTITQQINYQINSFSFNGVYVSRAPLKIMVPAGNKSAVVIPFVLSQDFQSIVVTSGAAVGEITTTCNDGYKAGSSCMATIQLHGGQYNSTVKISGTANDLSGIINTIPLTVSSNQSANIVTSINVFIQQQESTDAGNTQVTLYNSGLATANIESIFAGNPGIIVNDQGCVSLTPGNSCTIGLSASGAKNISTTVAVNYQTQNGTDNLSTQFTVNYYTNYAGNKPQITETMDNPNIFTNILVNNNEKYGPLIINYQNTGNVTLTNLAIPTGLMSVYPGLTIQSVGKDCVNGQSLSPGQVCNIGFGYMATKVESWSQPFAITGQYTNPNSTGVKTESITFTTEPQIITVAVLPQVEMVSILTTNTIYSGTIDSQNGYIDYDSLYPRYMPTGTTNADIAVSPTGQYVYVLQSKSPTNTTYISSYKIDLTQVGNGELVSAGTIVVKSGYPYSISMDITGKYIYVFTRDDPTVNNQLSIRTYQVESGGSLNLLSGPEKFGSDIACAPESFTTNMSTVTPDNKYLYVACTATGMSALANIFGFKLNTDGSTRLIGNFHVPDSAKAKIHARGIKSDSQGNYLYSLLNDGVANYSINPDNGLLTLEKRYLESSESVNLTAFALDSSSQNAYFGNSVVASGVNSYQKIFMAGINPDTGFFSLLNPCSVVSTVTTFSISDIGVEPYGNYVYTIGNSNDYDFLLIFRRDQNSGELTPISNNYNSPFIYNITPIKLSVFTASGD